MIDAPYSEKLVKPEDDTPESKAAREALAAVAATLHPTAPLETDFLQLPSTP